MNTEQVLLIGGAAAIGLYLYTKRPVVTTGIINPQPNQQYPISTGQANPYNGNAWGAVGAIGSNPSPTAAQQAAGVIAAIGGLATGVGSVVRGIDDWSSGNDTASDDG